MIRQTNPNDISRLIEIAEGTRVFKPLEVQALQDVLRDYFAGEDKLGHCAFSYEEFGVLVGFTYYAPVEMTDRTWDMYWIFVDIERQNKGIGSQVLHFAEADIRNKQGRILLIDTSSLEHYEPTRKFYLRNGYQSVARIPDYYSDSDDLLIFRKRL